jgi:hypothetical protein
LGSAVFLVSFKSLISLSLPEWRGRLKLILNTYGIFTDLGRLKERARISSIPADASQGIPVGGWDNAHSLLLASVLNSQGNRFSVAGRQEIAKPLTRHALRGFSVDIDLWNRLPVHSNNTP